MDILSILGFFATSEIVQIITLKTLILFFCEDCLMSIVYWYDLCEFTFPLSANAISFLSTFFTHNTVLLYYMIYLDDNFWFVGVVYVEVVDEAGQRNRQQVVPRPQAPNLQTDTIIYNHQ